jgi:hypothetical protein
MSQRVMQPADVIEFFNRVVGIASDPAEPAKRGRKSLRARLDGLVEGGELIGVATGPSGLPGNLWGAFNAVTQLATHESYSSSPLDNLYFGGGSKLLLAARNEAQAFLAA